MIIEKSFWENVGVIDSSSAESREAFALYYSLNITERAHAARVRRTESVTFTDLYGQDIASETRKEAA